MNLFLYSRLHSIVLIHLKKEGKHNKRKKKIYRNIILINIYININLSKIILIMINKTSSLIKVKMRYIIIKEIIIINKTINMYNLLQEIWIYLNILIVETFKRNNKDNNKDRDNVKKE